MVKSAQDELKSYCGKYSPGEIFSALNVVYNAIILPKHLICTQPHKQFIQNTLQEGIFVFLVGCEPDISLTGERLFQLSGNEDDICKQLLSALDDCGLHLRKCLFVLTEKELTFFHELKRQSKEKYKAIPTYPLFSSNNQEGYSAFKFPVLRQAVTWTSIEHISSYSEDERAIPMVLDDTLVLPANWDLFLQKIYFKKRINARETSTLLKEDQRVDFVNTFSSVASLSAKIKGRSLEAIREMNPRIDKCGAIFDLKSGAVCFSTQDWYTAEKKPQIKSSKLFLYFNEILDDAWQIDRPNFKRILFTPTKVLLRGEQYYVNMKNVSPFLRMHSYLKEMKKIKEVIGYADTKEGTDLDNYKLSLGFFDQVRNLCLSIFSFYHTSLNQKDFKGQLKSHQDNDLLSDFLKSGVNIYYSYLVNDLKRVAENIERYLTLEKQVAHKITEIISTCKSVIAENGLKSSVQLDRLVRGWREADLPLDNLITAMSSMEKVREKSERNTAVGIGWGGIELPLVFMFLCDQKNIPCDVIIARWSHYKSPNDPIFWESLNSSKKNMEQLISDRDIFLFDDNTLTGITLEFIRDAIVPFQPKNLSLFVTRYSGERRYSQMKMPGHGVVDPEVLLHDIGGYHAETPFARSWSTKEYENPVGVFSLSRRRILEAIYNNSSVEQYAREGF